MLTADQVAFYQENGYVLVQGMFTKEEAAAYRRECHELMERLSRSRNMDATWGSARGIAGAQATKVLHCHDVQFQSAAFGRLILDDRLTSAAAQVIGGENVQLHHTKMFIKPAEKGSPFPLHQDYPYFPHDRHSMIAAIIHFDDAPLEKGCVRVVPGSYKRGPLQHQGEGGWHLSPEEYPIERATPCPAKAGDALLFSYLTIHGSGLNTSAEARTTVLVQMRDPEDPPTVRAHESRGQGMILRGIDPSCSTVKPSSEVPAAAAMGAMGASAGMGGAAKKG